MELSEKFAADYSFKIMEDSLEDFQQQIDDIFTIKEKHKKVNSGDKGRRNERALCKELALRFGESFDRSVGSGNRWAQVKQLSKSSKDVLVGDIVCPDGFAWVLECKSGYEDKIDFAGIFTDGNKTIDKFLVQVTKDADRSDKKPMLLYKRNLKPWIAFVPDIYAPQDLDMPYKLIYRDWIVMSLNKLFEMPDSYFYLENHG